MPTQISPDVCDVVNALVLIMGIDSLWRLPMQKRPLTTQHAGERQ